MRAGAVAWHAPRMDTPRPTPAPVSRLNLIVDRALRRELRVLAAQRETTLRQLVRDLLAREVEAARGIAR